MENTMLIIDDSKLNREILTLLFKDNFEILEAENGEEGLEILESCNGNIDIVLLDLFMPDTDGREVLRQRQKLDYFRNVPVVVITASNAAEDQIMAFQLGANDFIIKPFIPEIVLSRVGNVMASTKRFNSIQLEAERLKVKSELDQMTGLLNKATVEEIISETLLLEAHRTHALLVVDIDNFKAVNDQEGHLVGDHTIRIVADCLSGLFRKSDIIGRIGGDEFVVLMTNVPSIAIVRNKVNELIQIMKYKPNLTIPANVSLSIGYALNNREIHDYKTLFAHADEALYDAKQEGKACAREYGDIGKQNMGMQRKKILVISRNRSTVTAVDALLGNEYQVCEIRDEKEMEEFSALEETKPILSYVDVSDFQEGVSEYWSWLKCFKWLWEQPILAVCEEGSLSQLKEALEAGVEDVLSAPLESGALKRRTFTHLRKLV